MRPHAKGLAQELTGMLRPCHDGLFNIALILLLRSRFGKQASEHAVRQFTTRIYEQGLAAPLSHWVAREVDRKPRDTKSCL